MPARLRLVTANLANGRAGAAAFARLVEALAPDVVAVQELGHAQADALARLLPFGVLEPVVNHTGMGIALRYPGPVTRLPLPRHDAYVAELAPPGFPPDAGPVEVINTHIVAPHLMPAWRALAARRGQLRALEAYLDAAPPRLRALVGDLNSTPMWPVYRRLAARFSDAAVEAARGNGSRPRRTWGPGPGTPRLLRIDHVLVAGLVALEARVVEIEGSDHSALVVDLAAPGSA